MPCTNTMHKVADQLTGLPLPHLGDATAAAVLRTVGLLGTAFTIEQDPRPHAARHALGLADMPGTSQGFTGRGIGESHVPSVT